MADPSGNNSSSPEKGSDSGSEGQSRERLVVLGSGDHGDSAVPPTLAPPEVQPPGTQPPAAQAGRSGERPMKKKAKMGKEVAAGMKVVEAEDPGKKKKFASLENLPGRARTCSICRREFPTARALFGHMRSHPERIWRGAHPPPVSPRREAEAQHKQKRMDAEQSQQAQELTRSLLNIGQRILKTSKFKEKEGFQAHGISDGPSSEAVATAHGVGVEKGMMKGKETAGKASGVVSGRPSGSSSGDSGKKKKKKKTGKALDYTDEDQRKRIHSQIDLNKEAPADEEEGETPGASSD